MQENESQWLCAFSYIEKAAKMLALFKYSVITCNFLMLKISLVVYMEVFTFKI
jgi:hypothetical protein